MLKKLAAISLTAGALVLAAPAVASAAPATLVPVETDSYAETPRVSVGSPIIDVCEVSTISFGEGYFLAGENVAVSVSGLNAADAQISGNVAAADGSLVLTFRPPSDGEGSYAVAFTGSRSYTAIITVSQNSGADCEGDPGVAPAGTELPLSGDALELALTGGGASPWVLGGGAVALAAGGVLIAAGAARRKRA